MAITPHCEGVSQLTYVTEKNAIVAHNKDEDGVDHGYNV